MIIKLTLEEAKEIIRKHIQETMPGDTEFAVDIFLDEEKEICIECERPL